jgi:hypothetical protein
MELISVAQQTGDVSNEVYNVAYHESGGRMPPPHLLGIEEQVPPPARTCMAATVQCCIHCYMHAWSVTATQYNSCFAGVDSLSGAVLPAAFPLPVTHRTRQKALHARPVIVRVLRYPSLQGWMCAPPDGAAARERG